MKTSILLTDPASGERFASASDEAVLATSGQLWNGFRLEHHILQASEISEHQVVDHRLMINIGPPVLFENKIDNVRVKQVYEYGDFKLLADQASNEPRWYNNLNMLAIAITPDLVKQTIEQDLVGFYLRGKQNDPLITHIAELLLLELSQEHLSGRILAEYLTTAFIIHLACNYNDTKISLRPAKGKLTSSEMKRVIDYIHEYLHKNIGLHELSDQVNLSAFHFSRLFRNTVGMAPHQFVQQLKLEQAQRLIGKSGNKLTDIAASLGFTDQAHFSKAFKKATGYSPSVFRTFN